MRLVCLSFSGEMELLIFAGKCCCPWLTFLLVKNDFSKISWNMEVGYGWQKGELIMGTRIRDALNPNIFHVQIHEIGSSWQKSRFAIPQSTQLCRLYNVVYEYILGPLHANYRVKECTTIIVEWRSKLPLYSYSRPISDHEPLEPKESPHPWQNKILMRILTRLKRDFRFRGYKTCCNQ